MGCVALIVLLQVYSKEFPFLWSMSKKIFGMYFNYQHNEIDVNLSDAIKHASCKTWKVLSRIWLYIWPPEKKNYSELHLIMPYYLKNIKSSTYYWSLLKDVFAVEYYVRLVFIPALQGHTNDFKFSSISENNCLLAVIIVSGSSATLYISNWI